MNGGISRKKFLRWTSGLTGSFLMERYQNTFNNNRQNEQHELAKADIILRGIPSSGEKVPVIGMGTWLTFDAGNSAERRKTLKEVLHVFHNNG